jgi:uncharacterized protein YlbG (UPF0298 family)
MENVIKFTDEEIKELNLIQDNYQEKYLQFGQLYLERLNLEEKVKQLNENESILKKEFVEIQKLEETFLNKITEKYGEGSLDAKTGVFTPKK